MAAHAWVCSAAQATDWYGCRARLLCRPSRSSVMAALFLIAHLPFPPPRAPLLVSPCRFPLAFPIVSLSPILDRRQRSLGRSRRAVAGCSALPSVCCHRSPPNSTSRPTVAAALAATARRPTQQRLPAVTALAAPGRRSLAGPRLAPPTLQPIPQARRQRTLLLLPASQQVPPKMTRKGSSLARVNRWT